MLGAVLYLGEFFSGDFVKNSVAGVANILFPKRAETLLVPKLAAMLSALRAAFGDVSALAKPNPSTVRQRSRSQESEEVERGSANPVSDDIARLRSVLAEVTQLVTLARDEPTYFGYYAGFDVEGHNMLVKDFGDTLLWLDEAVTAIVLTRQDVRLAAISERLVSLEFLRNELERHVDHALFAACNLLKSRFAPVAREDASNAVKRVSSEDDLEKQAQFAHDSENANPLVPFALWRMSRKFSAYNSMDTSYIVELATEQSKKKVESWSSPDTKFSNAAALAYLTFSVVIENCAVSMSGIVTDLDRILDDREASRRKAILCGPDGKGRASSQ